MVLIEPCDLLMVIMCRGGELVRKAVPQHQGPRDSKRDGLPYLRDVKDS